MVVIKTLLLLLLFVTGFCYTANIREGEFISTGIASNHSFIKSLIDHKICGFGTNSFSQLGLYIADIEHVPSPMHLPTNYFPFHDPETNSVIDIACGLSRTLFLSQTGTVYGCGGDESGQCEIDNANWQRVDLPSIVPKLVDDIITSINSGANFNILVTNKNKVIAFGDNMFGQLACGIYEDIDYNPESIKYFDDHEVEIEKVSCGYAFTVCIDEKVCYRWGSNLSNQVSHSSDEYITSVGLLQHEILDWFNGGVLYREGIVDVSFGSNYIVHLSDKYEAEIQKEREKAAKDTKTGFAASSNDEKVYSQNNGVKLPADSPKYVWKDINFKIIAIFDSNKRIFVQSVTVDNGGLVGVILVKRSFYGESGGEVGDIGFIDDSKDDKAFKVNAIQEFAGFVVHIGEVTNGTMDVDKTYKSRVDYENRGNIAPNHTMTPVLNLALRDVFGTETNQNESLVDAEKLGFDYPRNGKLSPLQIHKVSAKSNDIISQKLKVFTDTIQYKQATSINALHAMFGERYPEHVLVVSIGIENEQILFKPNDENNSKYSIESCGGTHLSNTSEAGDFICLLDDSIRAGITRIVDLTENRAIQETNELSEESNGTMEYNEIFENAYKLNNVQGCAGFIIHKQIRCTSIQTLYAKINATDSDTEHKATSDAKKSELHSGNSNYTIKKVPSRFKKLVWLTLISYCVFIAYALISRFYVFIIENDKVNISCSLWVAPQITSFMGGRMFLYLSWYDRFHSVFRESAFCKSSIFSWIIAIEIVVSMVISMAFYLVIYILYADNHCQLSGEKGHLIIAALPFTIFDLIWSVVILYLFVGHLCKLLYLSVTLFK